MRSYRDDAYTLHTIFLGECLLVVIVMVLDLPLYLPIINERKLCKYCRHNKDKNRSRVRVHRQTRAKQTLTYKHIFSYTLLGTNKIK